jgi:glycosyltransferase involved in cell wall biosynthesis
MSFGLDSKVAQVSVVILNHNYGRFLTRTIESVLAQIGVDVEIVVVDNGSTDTSRKIIEGFGDKVSFVYQGDVGMARGRNAGIEKSTKNLIAFLDADDYWEPTKLFRQTQLITTDVQFVYSGIRQFNDSDGATFKVISPPFLGDCRESFVKYPNLAIIPAGESCSLVTRSLIDRIGAFDITLNGATGRDFFRRCSVATNFNAIPEPLVHYRLHDSNYSKSVRRAMDDTELSYVRLFSDSNWDFALAHKKKCLRTLQWSFLKTNIKNLDFGSSILNIIKIIKTI